MSESDPAATFRLEAQDLLDQLEQALLDMAHTPDNPDLTDTAFRALHTIKGSGAMFGFNAVAAFTHHVETAFDLVRKGVVRPSQSLIAVALAAKDRMRQLIENPADADAAQGDAILRDLEAVIAGAGEPASALPGEQADSTWRIAFRLARDAMATGTNPLLLLDELRDLGTATIVANAEAVPPIEALEPTDCHTAWVVVLETSRPREAIEDVFIFVVDGMELSIEPLGGAPAEPSRPGQAEPPPARPLLSAVVSDPQPPGPPPALQSPEPQMPASQSPPLQSPEPPARPQTQTERNGSSIRVPAERLDDLMDCVGELVIAQSRLTQIAATVNDLEVKSIAEEIERLAMALRDTTMEIRTVPIAQLFGRYRRLIHDLSIDLGKQIELVTFGEETELDKTVIERLNDPLTHLIRNAVDHGLETPEGRIAAGKPPQGRITLSAQHAGGEVLISITDDGQGLNRALIQARAEEQGLLSPGAKPSDGDLFQVLFQPGFSTAREVTSLSGRGVGMDVVKRSIDGLRGKIDITSDPGAGTTMAMRLPLTLAIIDGLLVRVGGGRYVLPLSAVEECVELSPEADNRSRGRSFLNIRDDLVPFLRLRDLFRASVPADRYQKVVIVAAGDVRVGLVVDQIIGNHQTVIKSLSRLHAGVNIFSGATILGDGAVALILDIGHLVELGHAQDTRFKAAS